MNTGTRAGEGTEDPPGEYELPSTDLPPCEYCLPSSAREPATLPVAVLLPPPANRGCVAVWPFTTLRSTITAPVAGLTRGCAARGTISAHSTRIEGNGKETQLKRGSSCAVQLTWCQAFSRGITITFDSNG